MFYIGKRVILHSEITNQSLEMKNLIFAFALLVSVLGVSCKKGNEPQPQSPATAVSNINVEYRIDCPSGSASADYIAPNAAGKLEMTANFSYVASASKTPKIIS